MNAESNTAILYITDNGFALAKKLNSLDPNAKVFKFKPDKVSKFWVKHKNFIFIMASGIVVRTIAPLIKNKKTDPAVVVLDEKGEYAISLLSGHLGGANKIVREIAGFLGSQAVVTTASDVNNLPAIDLWAIENHLVIEDWNLLPQVTTKFLNKGNLKVYSDIVISMPTGFQAIDNPESADIIITNKNGLFTRSPASEGKPIHPFIQLYLRPKNLVIGIGCNSGTSADEIESSVRNTLTKNNLSFLSIHSIATIDRKGKEPGIVEFAKKYNFKIITFRPDELNSVKGIQKSESAFKATGAKAVAEPAALLASGSNNVLVPKQKVGNVTVAVAELRSEHRAKNTEQRQKGKLYIVGTGPGGIAHITPYAQNAIRKSDVIVGYSTYLDLIQGLIKDKEIFSTGMTQEIDRCKKAVELAIQGKTVSVISGGDPGIYAMAGLVFETLKKETEKIRNWEDKKKIKKNKLSTSQLLNFSTSFPTVEVIPGISALNACAAKLGAPLMHDFTCISLSDRLTPWELIEKRLEAAAMAGFVIILYNPKSKGRIEHISKARGIILKYRSPQTPVGIVKAAMRDNEKIVITNLKNMLDYDIDMQSTVIIGNTQTFTWDGWMVTRRGYESKFKIQGRKEVKRHEKQESKGKYIM